MEVLHMKNQVMLSLKELATLAVERLIEQGRLDNVGTTVDWYLSHWTPEKGYVVLSQED
jgi:hypothetical protein